MMSPSLDRDAGKAIAQAVIIAGLSAVVTKLVEWGIEAVRERVRKTAEAAKETDL